MKYRIAIFVGIISVALSAVFLASADSGGYRAVVVGVNRYPSTHAPALQGACGDAQGFAESCRARGMSVSLLEDGAASKRQILQTLQNSSEANLVFYFSGYGSGPAEPGLLCADTAETGPRLQGLLTLAELDRALLALPAREKTVVLDCCFTAPRASKSGPSEQVGRFYRPSQEADTREVMLASAQQLPRVSHNKIRYICASRYNEEALEGNYEGHPAGYFSALLCKTLRDFPNLTWQGVQVQVAGKLCLLAGDRQHPVFPAQCLESLAFKSSVNVASATLTPTSTSTSLLYGGPVNAWEAFGVDVPDSQAIQVSVTPDRDVVQVDQSVELKITVLKPGYLVVVGQGSEGGFSLLYPIEGQALRVNGGQLVQIPEAGMSLRPDRAGRERVKAFLFATIEDAEKFLKAAQLASGSKLQDAAEKLAGEKFGARGLILGRAVEPGRAPILTADLSFEVVPRVR